MITVCTVILDGIEPFYKIFLESVSTRTKLVDEVIVCKVDADNTYERSWSLNGITFKEFGLLGQYDWSRMWQGVEHGLGLQECVDKAKNEYVMFHDPDVFFYTAVDAFYLSLLQDHGLNYVGVSHVASPRFAYTFFPYLSCSLVRKKELPPAEWLDGVIHDDNDRLWPGKYLIRAKPTRPDQYPNPDGDFDTGSLLYLWAKEQNWKWLSFQTTDVHNYDTRYNRGSVKLKLPPRKLIYHATSSTAANEQAVKDFQAAYRASCANFDHKLQ